MYARDEYPIYKPAKAMHEYKKNVETGCCPFHELRP